jgi:uncharacterized repeat protein (TIGR01451 family)
MSGAVLAQSSSLQVTNQARATFVDGQSLGEVLSGTVTVNVQPPTIRYFTGNDYQRPAFVTLAGTPLYLRLDAPGCALGTAVAVTLTSSNTLDTATVTATQFAPGEYRVEVPTELSATSVPGDGRIQTTANDTIIASFTGCGNVTVTTTILIDPGGVVFDSQNNMPIAGAIVTLINTNCNCPAAVLQADGVTPAPSTVTTLADGHFTFPLVSPGGYRLQVMPPGTYNFPSVVAAAALPGRTINDPGSYGGIFEVGPTTGSVQVDVPLDPKALNSFLFVEKTASTKEAEIGDVVSYTVNVKNNLTNDLATVTLADNLPAGFVYLAHTTTITNTPAADPTGAPGPHLEFPLGSLAAGATATVTYKVRVGTGALKGDGTNRAQANGAAPATLSNIATASVKVNAGVFTDKAYLIGKVFVDKNHNDLQDDGEPGIPGVRIYLQSGTYAITDSEGKYSLYGLNAQTTIVKVDETTLPAGWKFAHLTPRHNRRGTLYTADLKFHELRKVNFADISDDPAVLAEVMRRRAKGDPDVAEIRQLAGAALTADGKPVPLSDVRAQAASGVVVVGTNASSFASVLPERTLTGDNSHLPPPPVAVVPQADLERMLADMTGNELDFLDLQDGDTLPLSQTNVRLKGPAGAQFVLRVNNQKVPATRVGKRVEIQGRQLQAWEYIAVGLNSGTNTLAVSVVDGFGNERATKQITVVAPGGMGVIKITLPTGDQPADGHTPARIKVAVTDQKGVPVTTRVLVTLEASRGRWDVPDVNPDEPGVQTVIAGGAAEYTLLPPGEPGDAKIVVSSGTLRGEATLAFLPDLRPMIAAGVVEGRMQFRRLNMSALQPVRNGDTFEQELRNWAFSGDNGKMTGAGRSAVFLKGKVKGDYLLTLAYDSEKEANGRLFRDIQPDEFYPVYGDSCVRGFDAQSTSRLYVRVDKRKCYLLYGDFNTGATGETRGLGNYSRSVTGIKEHYENNRVSANVWGSYDTTKQVITEFSADGTSGPYFFSARDILENSEKVEIIVRDRYQPAVVISVTPMTRFADYEFEPFASRLLFRAPVPSLDPNLNPVSIRVTYELDQGGDKFWVMGADGQLKLTPWLEIGGSTVHDDNPLNRYDLHSGNATWRIAPKTFLFTEVASSHTATNGTGLGWRAELRRTTDWNDVRFFVSRVEASFDNAASVISAGRQEIGAKMTQKLTNQDRLLGEAILTKDLKTSGQLWGASAAYEHTFDNKVRAEVGVRHSTASTTPASTNAVDLAPNSVTSVRGRLTAPIPYYPQAEVFGEYEQDVVHEDRRAASVGGAAQVSPRTKAYVRHEFLDVLASQYARDGNQQNNRTVFGLETDYMKDASLFNEYRMRDAISGREAEAALGLRNGWQVSEGLRFNTTFERVSPIIGTNAASTATAASLGFEYVGNPAYRATGRVEGRVSDDTEHFLNTLGYARKLNENWTLLARSILNAEHRKITGGDLFQSRLQLGGAYRPTDTDVWNALVKLEYKYEDDSTTPGALLLRHVVTFSAHLHWQATSNLTVSAQYAPKIVVEDDDTIESTYSAHLLAGRVMYDLTKRISIGLNASVFFSDNFRSLEYGVGPEIGFRLNNTVWLDAGYNILGFHDRDLSAENYTDQGFWFGMRMQFDEHLFDGLTRGGRP